MVGAAGSEDDGLAVCLIWLTEVGVRGEEKTHCLVGREERQLGELTPSF